MYVGNGQVIHAPYPGAPVRYDPVGMMPVSSVTTASDRPAPRPYDRDGGWSRRRRPYAGGGRAVRAVAAARPAAGGAAAPPGPHGRTRRPRPDGAATAGPAGRGRPRPGRERLPHRRATAAPPRRAAFDRPRRGTARAWSYQVTGVPPHRRPPPPPRPTCATASTGYDRAPVAATRTLSLRRAGRRAGTSLPTGPRGSPAAAAVGAGRGRPSSGASTAWCWASARPPRAARRSPALADRAVPAVSAPGARVGPAGRRARSPAPWSGMAGLLGAPAAPRYRGIAAVTTGETGRRGRAPADRIIVNPDAYGLLGDFGRQVVLTHETTHVATRAAHLRADPAVALRGLSPTGSATAARRPHPRRGRARTRSGAVRRGPGADGAAVRRRLRLPQRAPTALARGLRGRLAGLPDDRRRSGARNGWGRSTGPWARTRQRRARWRTRWREVLGTNPEAFTLSEAPTTSRTP